MVELENRKGGKFKKPLAEAERLLGLAVYFKVKGMKGDFMKLPKNSNYIYSDGSLMLKAKESKES